MIQELQAEILELTKFKNPEVLELVFSKLDKISIEEYNNLHHDIMICTQCHYKENKIEWDQYALEKKYYKLYFVRHGKYSYETEQELYFKSLRLNRYRPCKKCLAVKTTVEYKAYREQAEQREKVRERFKSNCLKQTPDRMYGYIKKY